MRHEATENRSLLPTSCKDKDIVISENYLTQMQRAVAKVFYDYRVFRWPAAMVTALVADIQAVFSYFVFTGFVDCSKDNPRKADLYYVIYYLVLVACFLLTVTNVIYERPRKFGKSANYIGVGTLAVLFDSSPRWIKTWNKIISFPSTGITGWNMASMFGKFPKDAATLDCIKQGWEMDSFTVCIGLAGVASAMALAAPQMASYYGRAKPVYGNTMTALAYAIFKVAMSLYPVIREVVKSGNKFEPQAHVLKLVCVLFITINRFRVYRMSNELLEVTFNYKCSDEFRNKIKQFRAENETSESERFRKEACTLLVNAKINQTHIDYLKSRGPIKQLYDALLPIIGCASVAYITTLSLEAIAKAMGVDSTTEWKQLITAVASVYAIPQLLKFDLGAIRTKTSSPKEFDDAFSTLFRQYQQCHRESSMTLPSVQTGQSINN